MIKALVTGGAGYFGEVLVQHLLRKGNAVRIFDLNRPGEEIPGVEAVQGNICDAAAVRDVCSGMDVVFHNVAQVPLAKDKALFWAVNRDGTANLLEASAQSGVRKVVYTSSSAIYGIPRSNPVTEQTEPSPGEAYGRAKLAGEVLCREYSTRGLDVSIVRPRTIMGHGRLGIFQILFEWIYQGSNIPVLGGGKNLYQFIHADDLAAAMLLAAQKPGSTSYNCGTNRFASMRELLERLCKVAGTGSKVKSLPMAPIVAAMKLTSAVGLSPLGPYHSMMYGRSMYFNTSKAQTELGWTPEYSNDEMFEDSYRWYVEHRKSVLQPKGGSSHHQSAVKEGALRMLRWVL